MYDTKENKHHIHIIDDLLNYRQPHQHIYLEKKKQELQHTNSKLTENLNIESLTYLSTKSK